MPGLEICCRWREGMGMDVALEFTDEEFALVREFAGRRGLSAEDFIRSVVSDKIEDELDIQAYYRAKAEFEANPVTYSHAEVARMLGLEGDES